MHGEVINDFLSLFCILNYFTANLISYTIRNLSVCVYIHTYGGVETETETETETEIRKMWRNREEKEYVKYISYCGHYQESLKVPGG